jgi:SAM-dependent methyltransferase
MDKSSTIEGFFQTHSGVLKCYRDWLGAFGTIPQGVGWNSPSAQHIRLQQIARAWEHADNFSVNDIGCGYGALIEFLDQSNKRYVYNGCDIEPLMLNQAISKYGDHPQCSFTTHLSDIPVSDFTVASGIFGMRTDISDREWEEYIHDTLHYMDAHSEKGFAFNMITSHVDYRVPELYYADPADVFNYCRSEFSPRVALLHDYPLYDFTVIVRYDE